MEPAVDIFCCTLSNSFFKYSFFSSIEISISVEGECDCLLESFPSGGDLTTVACRMHSSSMLGLMISSMVASGFLNNSESSWNWLSFICED